VSDSKSSPVCKRTECLNDTQQFDSDRYTTSARICYRFTPKSYMKSVIEADALLNQDFVWIEKDGDRVGETKAPTTAALR